MTRASTRVAGTAAPALPPAVVPRFFVVGAQKAGTTALHAWLARLPDIELPRDKETHYFTQPERAALGPAWYAAQFDHARNARGPRTLRGEVDPELLHHPEAPRRLASARADARIVVVLRDPLERARSQHAMSVARGLEPLGFVEALEAEQERLRGAGADGAAARHHAYLTRSRYELPVGRFRAAFGSERVHLVRFDELFDAASERARHATFEGLLRFVGHAGAVEAPRIDTVHNGRWSPRSRTVARLLHGEGRLRRVLGRALPSRRLRRRVGLLLDRWNRAAPAAGGPRPADLPAHWCAAFDAAVDEAERVSGWDCSAWRDDARRAAA